MHSLVCHTILMDNIWHLFLPLKHLSHMKCLMTNHITESVVRASLSEPHIKMFNASDVHMYVCMYVVYTYVFVRCTINTF